jgi:hypothetical protein
MSCTLFRAAWKKAGCKRDLWEKIRGVFHLIAVDSMEMLYRVILLGAQKISGRFLLDTS